jgi:hypothetical protein
VFVDHSIEELRVPDHSHLNIPPEMQAAAANSNNSSNSSQSSDTPAANSNSSSGSSTPRANSKDGSNGSKHTASKLPATGSKGSAHSSSTTRANSGRTSRASSNNSPVGQWAGYAGLSAGATAAAVMGSTNGIDRYCAALEQQRALMQLQLQAQGLAPSGGSFYEQQVQQMLKAAELAQAQQQQQQAAATQLLMYQSQQAAAAWSAQLARSSMGSSVYGDAVNRRSSPPLSPMPAGLGPEGCSPPYGCSPSFGSDNRNIFVPPSANSLNSSSSGSMPGWQSASLLRTLSTPANDCNSLASSLSTGGLIRHASSFAAVGSATAPHTAPHFASSGRAGMQMQHSSGGSSLADGQQEMTLASLLSGNCGGDPTWGPSGAPAASAGMMPASAGMMGPTGGYGGAGLGQHMGTQGMGQQMGLGSSLGGNAGMDMANLMLLQQQLQQKSALAGALDYLQQSGSNAGGQMGDCNNQAMGDMLGLMMQQLVLQQQSAVV